MERLPRIDKKHLSVTGLGDIEDEKRYWQSVKAQERLAALEIQRIMVYGKDRVTSRLQRLLETSGLPRS